MTDPEVSRNVGLRSSPTLERTEQWIERARTSQDIFALAIFDADQHVGNVVLDKVDLHLQSARISIYVGDARARGRGVGRAAIEGALEIAFGRMALRKVWLTVHAKNARAIATYVALGFAVEGVLRDEFILDGKYVAALYMGLLRSEFSSRVAAL